MQVCYGMTEFSPVGCQTLMTDTIEKRVETVGLVHPNVEVCSVYFGLGSITWTIIGLDESCDV